ncbi:Transmembrane 9 superfamily member 2 [Portunus trituberculatus]|uniref:Transmembrane 9 superfamily member 2 n=1 Tax=Portunus trituberculatus TaxID=210409 RepID=A0A5B7DSF5_PORTR|nr:Transmembrane 9 superfamily member 2 [Portunus trituberculatus]
MYPVVVAVLVLVVSAQGFYLPGLAPVNYCQKGMFEESKCQTAVPLFVNRLNSEESIIPYEYSQ